MGFSGNSTSSSQLASFYLGQQGLSNLQYAAKKPTAQTIEKVARQFESVFINMMLKSMEATVPKNSLFGSSQERLFRSLYDHQLSVDLSQGQGIGLRNMIEKALRQNPASLTSNNQPEVSSKKTEVNSDGATMVSKSDLHPSSNSDIQKNPMTKQTFVNRIWSVAKKTGAKLGLNPDVLVAQAAVETGWGKKIPVLPDGKSSFNLFGIKAGSDWKGPTVTVPTVEYHDGVAEKTVARFRAYPSVQACFKDYAHLITNHPRYQQALAQTGKGKEYLQGLQKAGYATDPHYAAKIENVLRGDHALFAQIEVNNSGKLPIT